MRGALVLLGVPAVVVVAAKPLSVRKIVMRHRPKVHAAETCQSVVVGELAINAKAAPQTLRDLESVAWNEDKDHRDIDKADANH